MIRSNTPIETDGEMPLRRPADLPDFKRPPVTEVVLSLQFASLSKFRNAYVGLLWERFRNEYPNVSEQAPLPATFETFGAIPANPSPFLPIEALLSPPTPRFWFEEKEGVHLLQIQQDRILHNWRKRETEQDYPRYETIRDRFELDLKKFGDFLAAEDLGELRTNQCEVTYINTIDIPGEENVYQKLQRITPLWTGHFAETYALEIESATVQGRFVLRDSGRPFGRAYVTFGPGILLAQNRPVIRLEITVRGKPRDESIPEALRLLDEERNVVVRTFTAVTTPEMWNIWERTDASQ
jgi:uncharacterized protein (TIGR04255 family)